MTNIYDLANELERGIRALPEYKTLVEKKKLSQLMLRLVLFSKSSLISKRISMLKCKLVQCQQQKNKQLFKNWGKKWKLMTF